MQGFTASALLAGGQLTRYPAINDRLRAIVRERLELLPPGASAALRDPFTTERLEQLDVQVPGLLHRHTQARDALLGLYGANLIFIGDMFVIALAPATSSDWLADVALLFFGPAAGPAGGATSHQAPHCEVRRVTAVGYERALGHKPAAAEPPGTIAN